MTTLTHRATISAAATMRLSTVHILLTVQSIVIILLSLNRLGTWTLGYVAPNEFLRWVDLNNMLVLPLISVVAFYLLKKRVEQAQLTASRAAHLLLNVGFVVGVYLLAAGYGDHEVTNYLHVRFCLDDPNSDLCRIIIFNDDEFSHWVFFAGFILINAALMLLQVIFPERAQVSVRDTALLIINGLFIGLGLFANLAFEEIGIDLYVVAAIALLAVVLIWRKGRQPLLIYYNTAYLFGLISTFVVKTLS